MKKQVCFILALALCSAGYAKNGDKDHKANKRGWSQEEYSGARTAKDRETALLSKGFAWLSGSPADNEVLSVGKIAQFFGFVALRYESGRAAKRGSIGTAFHDIATEAQRERMQVAVDTKQPVLEEWWVVRNRILDQLEKQLYNGQAPDLEVLKADAAQFGWLNAQVALIEARAIADVERSLNDSQWQRLRALRQDPDLANAKRGDDPLAHLPKAQRQRYEDQFAKGFSWLTGDFKQREIIPKGQPAQFFGFVAIRHHSGHGASRGDIAKRFKNILDNAQKQQIRQAVSALAEWEQAFFKTRTALMKEMEALRGASPSFDLQHYNSLAKELGVIEVIYAAIEAKTYIAIDQSLSVQQRTAMAALRADYIVDENQIQTLNLQQRGEQLMTLCNSCHETGKGIAPSLKAIVTQSIASQAYDYSRAMKQFAAEQGEWTEATLALFLADPQQLVPGTTMAFKGLQNEKDRQAVIAYLKGTASP